MTGRTAAVSTSTVRSMVAAVGALAPRVLWRYQRPGALPAWVVRVALVAALVERGAMGWTGLLGSEVRLTEIRSDFVPPAHIEGAGA